MRAVLISIAVTLITLTAFGAGFLSGLTTKAVISGLNATILVQTLAIVVTVMLALWNYKKTKEKEIDARLFSEKAKIYENFIEAMQYSAESTPTENKTKGKSSETLDKGLVEKLLSLQHKSIVWGNQDLIDVLAKIGEENVTADDTYKKIADIYRQMRRELGHNDRPTIGWDVLSLLIKPSERPLIRAAQIRSTAASLTGSKPKIAEPVSS